MAVVVLVVAVVVVLQLEVWGWGGAGVSAGGMGMAGVDMRADAARSGALAQSERYTFAPPLCMRHHYHRHSPTTTVIYTTAH